MVTTLGRVVGATSGGIQGPCDPSIGSAGLVPSAGRGAWAMLQKMPVEKPTRSLNAVCDDEISRVDGSGRATLRVRAQS
jgi:hypothetical protein